MRHVQCIDVAYLPPEKVLYIEKHTEIMMLMMMIIIDR